MDRDLSRSRAILIGNSRYRDRKIPNLPGASLGVRAMADLLTGDLCGWPASRVEEMTDVASPSELARRIVSSVRDVHSTGVLLLYYVGHGQRTVDGQLALTLRDTDADPQALPHTAILYDAIAKILRGCQAATKLVILDCCHAELGTRANFQFMSAGVGLAEAYPVDGLYFIGASRAYEKAKAPLTAELTYFTRAFIDVVRAGIPGKPPMLRLDQIFVELRGRMMRAGLPEPVESGIRGAHQLPFARNAAPETNEDLEEEMRQLRERLAAAERAQAHPTPAAVAPAPGGSPHRRTPVMVAGQAAGPGRLDGGLGTGGRGRGTSPGAAKQRPQQPRRTRPWLRSPALLAGIMAGLAAIAAVTWVLLIRTPGGPRGGHQPGASPASWDFAPHQYADGLVVTRRWTLSGHNGSLLTEKVTASSASGKALLVPFEEPVPAAVAANLETVQFTPAPSRIVNKSHLVEWQLRVPAHGTVSVGYRVTVAAAGATRARLTQWVKDFDKLALAQGAHPSGVRLESLRISQRTIRIATRQTFRLTLSGVMSDGTSAAGATLARVGWKTADKAVATVSPAGKVTGKKPGKTRVTAQIGTIRASVAVTVISGAAVPTPGTGGSYTPAPPTSAPPPTTGPTSSPTPTLTPSPLGASRVPGQPWGPGPQATAGTVLAAVMGRGSRSGTSTGAGQGTVSSKAAPASLFLNGAPITPVLPDRATDQPK